MCHFPPGTAGLAFGIILFVAIWLTTYCPCPFASVTFEPRGPGSFDSRLLNYTKAAETVIGLASGSVILLVGSSVLRTNSRLPWYFASPLVLLGLAVSFSVFHRFADALLGRFSALSEFIYQASLLPGPSIRVLGSALLFDGLRVASVCTRE